MTRVDLSTLLSSVLRPDGDAPIHSVSVRREGRHPQQGSAGVDPNTGNQVQPDHAFRIASISKMVTAALTLLLVEEGLIALDDPVAARLPHELPVRLNRFDGHDHDSDITLRHLLSHTSGVADYITDDRFVAEVSSNVDRQWDAPSILRWFETERLEYRAVAPPGQLMHYSDTNYVLLGLLIEHLTGVSLHQSLTEHIFQPLGMENTYLEFHQSRRGEAPMVYPYMGGLPLREVNTSFDWGGGGLVSTHADLHRFIRATLSGELFANPHTLEQMLDVKSEDDPRFLMGADSSAYGLGVRQLRIRDQVLYGHSGSWGCAMYYSPATQTSITATVNQADNDGALAALLLALVAD